jgi:hypothetical protein
MVTIASKQIKKLKEFLKTFLLRPDRMQTDRNCSNEQFPRWNRCYL